jgi:hypothetical protein
VGIEAGGYRLTVFGEPFLNFGFYGVVCKGAVLGFFFYFWDYLVIVLSKRRSDSNFEKYFYLSALSIVVVNFYDIRFFVAYFLILLLIFKLNKIKIV